jgi:hypothetical protein
MMYAIIMHEWQLREMNIYSFVNGYYYVNSSRVASFSDSSWLKLLRVKNIMDAFTYHSLKILGEPSVMVLHIYNKIYK